MTYEQLIASINPEIYRSLRQAVELGKWPDGRVLSVEQKEICMQAVIYYENQHNVPETERVGFLDMGKKANTACAAPPKIDPDIADALAVDAMKKH